MGTDKEVERLLDACAADMGLSELDGFLTGIHLCPTVIMPSEWVNEIWYGEEPDFEDLKQAQATMGALMAHYNSIAKRLSSTKPYKISLSKDDEATGQWEYWIGGFIQAMQLRSEDWRHYEDIEDDEDFDEALIAFGVLTTYMELAERQKDFDDSPTFRSSTAKMIAQSVKAIFNVRDAVAPDETFMPSFAPANENRMPVRKQKIGRNEPCPCGSGKKYKKCCGAH